MQNAVQPLIKDGCDIMSIICYNIIDTSLAISHLFICHSREREAMKDEGLTMAQWINLTWKNRSVLVHCYSAL